MSEMFFNKKLRDCPCNERAALSGESLIYDYEVVIDGAHVATFKKHSRLGRGYDLVANVSFHHQLNTPGGNKITAKTQADFAQAVDMTIRDGKMPNEKMLELLEEEHRREEAGKVEMEKAQLALNAKRAKACAMFDILKRIATCSIGSGEATQQAADIIRSIEGQDTMSATKKLTKPQQRLLQLIKDGKKPFLPFIEGAEWIAFRNLRKAGAVTVNSDNKILVQ